MWSILVLVGSLNFGVQYMSPEIFTSQDACEQAALKLAAQADFPKKKGKFNVRCEWYYGQPDRSLRHARKT